MLTIYCFCSSGLFGGSSAENNKFQTKTGCCQARGWSQWRHDSKCPSGNCSLKSYQVSIFSVPWNDCAFVDVSWIKNLEGLPFYPFSYILVLSVKMEDFHFFPSVAYCRSFKPKWSYESSVLVLHFVQYTSYKLAWSPCVKRKIFLLQFDTSVSFPLFFSRSSLFARP